MHIVAVVVESERALPAGRWPDPRGRIQAACWDDAASGSERIVGPRTAIEGGGVALATIRGDGRQSKVACVRCGSILDKAQLARIKWLGLNFPQHARCVEDVAQLGRGPKPSHHPPDTVAPDSASQLSVLGQGMLLRYTRGR